MRQPLIALCLFASLMLLGCAGERYRYASTHGPDRQPVITRLAEKAATYEAADEIQLALLCWRSILEFDPEHQEALTNRQRLEAQAQERARASYQAGSAALAQTRPKDARRALLVTLRLDPRFLDARRQLDQFMNPPVYKWYRIEPGESLADLSRKFYRTADGADLIAFANDLPANAQLLSPRMLKIPVRAAPPPPYQVQKTDHDLVRARKLSKAGRHEKVIVLTERLRRADPKLREAVQLENRSRFALGQRYYRQRQYLEAKKMLDGIQGTHPGLEALRADLRAQSKKQAEVHYRDGVKFFLNDELERAVEKWRLVLALDPEHEEAAASIREAETLLQKLKTVEEE